MNKIRKYTALSVLLAVFLFVVAVIPTAISTPSTEQTAYAATTPSYTPTYSGTYYNTLNTELRGEAFRTQLANLITSTHKHETSYNELTSIYAESDRNPNGSGILLFYTGTVVSSYGSYGANREHVWPKDGGDAFPAKSKAGSDAHHLRPCDNGLNSTRGSLSFGETTTDIVKQNGSTSYGNLCYKGGGFFYPGKGYRGATARILMYVQTRWGNDYSLKFVDGAGHCKTIGDFDTLYKWHLEEPPTESEIIRNNCVATIQGNRNPFIDHPEYAYYIYSQNGSYYASSGSTLASSVNKLTASMDTYNNLNDIDVTSLTISPSSLNLAVGQTASLSVTASPAGASSAVTWSSSNTSVATVSADGKVTAVAAGSANLVATSKSNSSVKAYAAVTVKAVSDLQIEGSPTKTAYYAGDKFDPSGLTVRYVYSDGSTAAADLSTLNWVDGTTGSQYLSEGTTHIICSLGTIQKRVDGITVSKKAVTAQTAVITRKNFECGTGYGWWPFTVGDLSGKAYIFDGASDNLQLNLKNGNPAYLFNDAPCSGGITTVQLKGTTGNTIELFVSKTPFSTTSEPTATSLGQKSLADSPSWQVPAGYEYFAIKVVSTNVCRITEISVGYGITDEKLPVDSVVVSPSSVNMTVGSTQTLSVTANGSVTWQSSDENVVTVSNGILTAKGVGTATVTATRGTAKATVQVTVSAPVVQDKVVLDRTSATLTVGDTLTVKVIESTGSVTWQSNNENVVTVSNGILTAKGAGSATVYAVCGNASAAVSVTVNKASGGSSGGSSGDGTDVQVTNFVSLVGALQGKEGQELFNAIKSAAQAYNALSAEQRAAAQDACNLLTQAISAYNQSASQVNSSVTEVFANVSGGATAMVQWLLVLVYIIKSKLF